MTITAKPKSKATNIDEFIGAAPDSSSREVESTLQGLATKRGTNRSQVSVIFADELLAKIDDQAKSHYMTRSAYITMALNKFLED